MKCWQELVVQALLFLRIICKETKNGNQDILCLYRARLSDEHYLYHHIRYKLVRALDTIVVDAAHHVWLLRVVGCTPSVVLRSVPVKKVIVAFLLKEK